jgi:predicted anti-sigma-YlaC factor YlaD
MSCEVYRELLPAYLDESLDEVRRAGFRAHLTSCSECRELAIAAEPTLIFSLSRRSGPSSERIEACVTSVIAGVRQERLQKQLRPSRRPWLAVAAAVMLAIIASTAWWMRGNQAVGLPQIQADAHEVEVLVPTAVEAMPAPAEPPPRVEVDMIQEEVRVYQYAIGDDGTTGAVFIVNPAMEL